MTDYYFGAGGDNADFGSLEFPWETQLYAVNNATQGADTLILLDGVNPIPNGNYWSLAKDFLYKAQTSRGATVSGTHASWVVRTSSGLELLDNPFILQGLIIKGVDGVNVQAMELGVDISEDIIVQLHDCEFISGTKYCIWNTQKRGRLEIVHCTFTGTPSTSALSTITESAKEGNQTIDIQDLEAAITLTGTGDTFIHIEKVDNLTYTFDVQIKGVFGEVTSVGNIGTTLVDIYGVDAPIVTNCNVTLNGNETSQQINGIQVRGKAVAKTTNAVISNNRIKLNTGSGYGIMMGDEATDDFVSGGIISGNHVIGKYWLNKNPSNILLGRGTSAECLGNIAQDSYVGYDLSRTTSATLIGNLAFDCYGASYYVKGTTACTIRNNIACLSGKYTQRNNGILSVGVGGGGTNTVAATIQENLIIVSDIDKIHSLAQISNSSQACSFVRNTYIIPDTVDLSTKQLFAYEASTANKTIQQWKDSAKVTDDVVVLLPAAKISELILKYQPSSGGSSLGTRIGI